jgi:hypothetical protein
MSMLKARLKAASAASKRPILMGQFYGVVEKFVAKTFKSGAFGFELTYALTDKGDNKGRKIFENIVMNKSDGSLIKFADEKLVRRLYSLGIGDAELESFNVPETSDEQGDLDKLHGVKVLLTLEQEIRRDNGEPSQKVKKVERPKLAAA